MTTPLRLGFALFAVLLAGAAHAQYSPYAGTNAPMVREKQTTRDPKTGDLREQVVERKAPRDSYGNAQGHGFDLAVDGAFNGQTIVVLQQYDFSFEAARAALKEKGFSVYRFSGTPSVKALEDALAKANQFWIISGDQPQLTDAHLAAIRRFFEAGHGVYIWGDNQPYYADANRVGSALLDVTMEGDIPGDQVVGLQKTGPQKKAGLLRGHLLTTGLEYVYEGITIATIQPNEVLTPLIYGSADNLVAGFYDRAGKRAIFDGGFTRLYNKWDTAGTARYVKNAAAWLANAERFGSSGKGAQR